MARQAPNPVEVQDFQFKSLCRLKIFANEENDTFSKPCSLLAAASRFGLIFVGTASSVFQVIQLNTIEKHTITEGEITNYKHRNVSLPSPPRQLAVNCDCTKLAVVVERNNCPIGLIYDIASMMKQELSALTEIRLSSTPGVNVIETSWNPSIPNIFTACKDDGTLGLYELKETGIDINELPAESQATCMCWSPKGKQIAVGSRNGKITQYKPDLKAMKVVNAPPMEGSPSVIALQWISNYQFIAVYKPQTAENGASLLVVDAPKTGDTVYTNYEDICYSYGNMRPTQFYTIFQSTWNILMVASSNSMEVGVLGSEKEQWMQWILADSARAELPLLGASKLETMPVGLAFDTAAIEPVLWGETSLPAAPLLLLLSHHGLLCCFRVINIKSGVASLCQAPEPFADTSGLGQFTSTTPEVIAKPSIVELPKPVVSAPIPSKPVEPISQAPFSFSQSLASTTPKLPQVPLFTTPPTSLFGSQSPLQASKPESAFMPKLDLATSLSAKTSQNLFTAPLQQQPTFTSATSTAPIKVLPTIPLASVAMPSPASVPGPTVPVVTLTTPVMSPVLPQSSETSIGQEEADILIGKLIREECEGLEVELKSLLHKGRSLKIDLGSDTEAVELVHGTDILEDFLKEVKETSAGQAAEVHSLKQGLIQTWAWYEDARSRYAQTQDAALEALLRIQQLDPVSQRYLTDIQYMCYYLNSQLIQGNRVLDEQWENFQDSCKKVIKLKIPTMEAIYQTMVRQSAIHQRQQYILKDISSRIRAQRSKLSRPSLLVSLKNVDQLEKELQRLQLEPQHILQAQYERVLQDQQRLTASKVQKLRKLLLDKKIVHVASSKPKLSSSTLLTSIQASSASSIRNKNLVGASSLGAALSPISTGKHAEPRAIGFAQSTPKPMLSAISGEQKQSSHVAGIAMKVPMSAVSKFSTGVPVSTPVSVGLGQFSASNTTTIMPASKMEPSTTSPMVFKFAVIPSTSVISSSTSSSASPTSTNQLNFGFGPVSTAGKVGSVPALFAATPISQSKTITEPTQSNQFSFNNSLNTTKPSVSFGSLFGSTKSTPSTFSFNSPTSTTMIQAPNNKPLTSTSSSAFVPTTQLAFNFSAKNSNNTSALNLVSVSNTVSKSSAFVFGTTAPVIGSTNVASVKSDSGIKVSSSQAVSTNLTTAPSTTSVTVVASATSTASFPVFDAPKTTTASEAPAVISTAPFTAPISASLFKASGTEAVSASTILSIPKVTASVAIIQQATESTTIPSSEATTPTSTDAKATTPAVVTSNQGSLFGAIPPAPTASLFSFANAASNIGQPLTTPEVSAAGDASIILTKPEKEPLLFAKVTPSTGSIFSNAATFGTAAVTTATGSFPATTTTATASLFGSVPTKTTAATESIVSATSTSALVSLLSAPKTTTAGSLFGAAPVTVTSGGSIFGTVPSQAGFISTTSSSMAPVFSVIPTTTTSAPAFSPSVSTPTATTTTSSTGFTTSSSIFGSVVAKTASSGSIFNVPSTTTASIFGAAPTTTSVFGAPAFGTATTTTSSIFAQPTTTAPSVFGAAPTSPVFGGTEKTTSSGQFGSPAFAGSTTNTFGSSNSFGSTTTASSSVFGQPAAFGSGSIFGAPVSNTTSTFGNAPGTNFGTSGSVFGTPGSASSNFGQSQSSTFSFAAANVPSTNSAFGFSKPSAFGFGGTSGSTESSSFSFGNLNVGSPTTTANTVFGSGFGQSSNSNPFAKVATQEQKPAFGGGSIFSSPTTTASSSIFGGGSTSGFGSPSFGSPGFGSPSTFGQQQQQPQQQQQQSAFGQSSFGGSFGSPSQPGPFSGGNQSVAQTGFGGFGQSPKPTGFGAAPVFGGSPTGFGAPPAFGSGSSPGFGAAPAFGSPSKVFGGSAAAATPAFGAAAQQENPTFANFANQNTLGFGSLAQQTQTNPSMSSFSGGTSFSTWR